MMTVAELIKKLSEFDPKAQVVTLDAYCDCVYIKKYIQVTIIERMKMLLF